MARFFLFGVLAMAGLLAPLICPAASLAPEDAPYLLSYHDDSNQSLVIANSTDGVAFKNLLTFYTPPAGDGVRDPSLIHYRGVWYVVYTAGNFGAASYFGVAKSDDFQHWTWVCNVTTHPAANAPYTWAPEFFLDPNDGHLFVFVHLQRGDGGFDIYAYQPTQPDLSAWDGGVLVGDANGSQLGYIDSQVTGPIDGFYYMIARPYGEGSQPPLNILRSPTLLTGWRIYKEGDFAGWQLPHNVAEAGNLLHYGGGHWRIYTLPETGYGTYPYSYSDSFDDLTTWTPLAPVTGTTNLVHGTVLMHTPPIFTAYQPPAATVGQPYLYALAADGRPAPALTLTAGSLPPGLSLDAHGQITGTPTLAGIYSNIQVTAANGVSPDATRTVSLVVNRTFADFAAAAGSTGTAAGPLADPDGDGWLNLLEYALHLSPTVAEPGAGTVLDARLRPYADGPHLSTRFTRDPLATDLIYMVEVSDDLQTWHSVAISSGGGAFSGPGVVTDDAADLNPHIVEIRNPSLSSDPSSSRQFLRLRVVH